MNLPLDTLPTRLVLPPLLADRVRGGSNALDQIQSAADLPERLFFGDLDESSFHASGAGWSARYRGAFEMGGLVTFDGRQLVIDQTFLGAPIYAVCHPAKLIESLRILGLGSQAPLDTVLQEWIGDRLNVRVVPTPEDAPSSWQYPDGPMRDIWLPVPTHRMRDLAGLHCVLAGIEEIGAGLRGSFILGTSTVNYIEGRNEPNYEDPDSLCIDALQQLGLPPVELPVRQQPPTGPAAWTLPRLHYFYRLTGFLRDMPVLLEALQLVGFIGTPGASNGWPHAPEYAAVVLAPELAVSMDHLARFDQNHTRRVYLPTLDRDPTAITVEFDADRLESGLHTIGTIAKEVQEMFNLQAHPDHDH